MYRFDLTFACTRIAAHYFFFLFVCFNDLNRKLITNEIFSKLLFYCSIIKLIMQVKGPNNSKENYTP